jgi:peptide/nickel transport system permease protein
MRYVERRLIHAFLLVIGTSILCFLFANLAPGSFFDEMKLNPQISADTLAGLRAQYGMDRPMPLKYALWMKSVFRGDWGYSFSYNTPVRKLLAVRARNTLLLTGLSTLLAWLIAIPLGVWAADQNGRWPDRAVAGLTSLFMCLPELAIVLGFLYVAVRTHALPVGGMTSTEATCSSLQEEIRDVLAHLLIPVATLVLVSLPILVRHVRASMLESLEAPFITAARGHGIGHARLLFHYALPSAANPLISLFGLSVAGLLSGSLMVEVMTGWPGLGPLLLEASLSRDFYVVIGAVMVSTIFMISGGLLSDVLLVMTDPRVRTE